SSGAGAASPRRFAPPPQQPAKRKGSSPALSSSTEPVRVARPGRPHGLDGFLGLYVDEEDLVHFEVGSTVRVGEQSMTVRAIRRADKGWQVAFEGVADRNTADRIRNQDVFVETLRELAEGEYWDDDLIGLEVDRKSTRLNSSHVKISYAVFCLK